MHRGVFSFTFSSQDEVQIVHASLAPEMKQKIPKTKITVKQEKNCLVLEIIAPDASSLRAASNSYLRWIQTAHMVHDLV